MTFGQMATARMKELRLRQVAVAEAAQLSQPVVCRLMNDQRPPTPETAEALANALDIHGEDRVRFLRLAAEAAGYKVSSPAA